MAMVAADDPEDVEGLGAGQGGSSRGAGAGAGAGAELVGSGPDESDENPPQLGEAGQRRRAARHPHVPKLPPVGG